MSVKITALEAENVKRIKAVALTPSPTGLTIVGGNNNSITNCTVERATVGIYYIA